jgi:hypothetical protein
VANNFEINLAPGAFILPSSSAPSRGVVQNREYLAFDDTAVESCRSRPFAMPAAYTGSGTLKADLYYMMASATSDKVDFEVSVEAVTAADATDLDAGESFDTANAGNQTVPGTAGYLGVLTITLTNKDSVAAGDYVRLKIERDADDGTDDTASGDARLLLVVVREEA